MSTEPRVIENGNITIIDPNPIGHTINHEDMYIYASLIAKTRGRTFLTQKVDNTYEELETVPISTVDLVISDSATQEGVGKRAFLTTNWTEIGGSQFKDTNVSGDLEGFGITNVDIEIKGSYIPKVVIDFIDIRGATLFEQGSCSPYALFFHLPYPIFELTVKGYYGKPITYYLNLVKFNTKFNSQTGNFECRGEFIGWSYAFLADVLMGFVRCAPYMDKRWNSKGILRNKYDEAIKYYIDNGLYDETDYYQESSTNDVTLQDDTLVRQPFCYQGDGGTVNCITLTELHKRIQSVEEFLGYAKGDNDYQNLANLVSLRNDVNQLLNDILDFSRRLIDDGYVENNNIKVSNQPNRTQSRDLFIFNGPPNDDLKDLFKEYFERYISGNEDSGLGVFARQTSTIKNQKISENECGGNRVAVYSQVDSSGSGGLTGCAVVEDDDTFKFQFLNGLNNSGVYFQKGMLNATNNNNELNYVDQDASGQATNPGDYYIDLGWYIYPIEQDLKKLDEEITTQRNAVKEAIDRGVTERLGFRPTVRNVFTILTCNVETFIQLLLDCCILAEEHHNNNESALNSSYGGSQTDKLLELKNRSGNQDKQIFPWPTYYKEDYRATTTYNSNDPKKETKEVYPGENTDFFDWPEVRFVEDFIKACEKLNEEDEALAEDLTGVPGFDNYIPINPLESQLVHNGTDVAIKYRNLLSSDLSGRSLEDATLQFIGERMFITLDFTHFDPVRYNPFNIGMGFSAPQKNSFKPGDNLDELEDTSSFNERRLWMGGLSYYNINGAVADVDTPLTALAAIDAHNLFSCIEDKKVLSQLNLLLKRGDLSEEIARVFKKISENRTEPNGDNDWFNENYDYKSQSSDYPQTKKILENNLQDISGYDSNQYWAYHPKAGYINLLSRDSKSDLGSETNDYGVRIYSDVSQMRPEYLFQMWKEEDRSSVRKIQFNDKPEGTKARKEELLKKYPENISKYLTQTLKSTANSISYQKSDDHKITYFDGSTPEGKSLFITLNVGQSGYDDTIGIKADEKFDLKYSCLPLFVGNSERGSSGYVGENAPAVNIVLLSNYLHPCAGVQYFNQQEEGETAWNFAGEIANRGIFKGAKVGRYQDPEDNSYTFGTNADNLPANIRATDDKYRDGSSISEDSREKWGDTIVYDTLVQTPLWLDNVNRFRKSSTNIGGSGQNLNASQIGIGRPLTTSNYELKGPAANTINRASDYTSDEIQNRNLAYLFLASCKITPFITAGGRQNNDDGDAIFNYINEHYPKALVPFGISGNLIKAPKAWVLGIGSVLWRWKMYMGVDVDPNGNIRWRHPNFRELPIGFDPLAQPGHPSESAVSLESTNNVMFSGNKFGFTGRKNRSTTKSFTLNGTNYDTYENRLFATGGAPLWATTNGSNAKMQTSCFASITTRWYGYNRGFYGASTAESLPQQTNIYGTYGYNFDYWGVYNNDDKLRDTKPQSWDPEGGNFWSEMFWRFVDGYADPVMTPTFGVNAYIYEDFYQGKQGSGSPPFQKQIMSASEATRYTYWPILFITPWQHFYTEAVSYNGTYGYSINNVENGTNEEGYNSQVEKTLTLIFSDTPARDYVGNFGRIGDDNSNMAAGFSTSKKYSYDYQINVDFVNKNTNGFRYSDKEILKYENKINYRIYGAEINGTDVKNWFTIDGGKYSELISLLPTFVKESFVEEFEKWCDSEWKTTGLKIIDPVNFKKEKGINLLAESYLVDWFTDTTPGDDSYSLNKLIGHDASDSFSDPDEVNDAYVGVIALNPNKTEVKDFFETIFNKYYYMMVSTPRLFGLDIFPGKRTDGGNSKNAFMANKKLVDKYLEAFQVEWNKNYKDKEENLAEENELDNENVLDDSDTKLSLYRSFKSICDKWISTSKAKSGKYSYFFNITDSDVVTYKGSERVPLAGHFTYVNRVMGEIGNKAVIDVTKLKTMRENPKISFYNLISDLLGENKFDFFPLPSFTNFTGKKNGDIDKVARDMFSPYTDNIVKTSGPNFICMYVGGTSRIVDLKPKPNCPKDQEDMNYNDDGFPLSEEGADIPYEYHYPTGNNEIEDPLQEPVAKYDYKDDSRIENQGFTAFRVAYGLENQNHFKSVELDQTEFTETNESLMVIEKLADGGNPANRTQKGNNLHNIYLTRSYTCKVGSLGNMMIQPLQYFELSNIPMFYGTYLITEVTHNIKPHHIETNFKGVRQPIATVPVVEDVSIAMSQSLRNIEAKTGRDVLDTSGSATVLDDCEVFGDVNTSDSDISFGSSDTNTKGCAIASRLKQDLGLTLEQASGIVGNLIKESGLKPAIIQCNKGAGCPNGLITESGGWDGSKFGESGNKGYGWAQWTFYSLKNDFITHAKGKGVDLTKTQATDEINYSYLVEWVSQPKKLAELKKQKTVKDAAIYFAVNYENCKACSGGSEQQARTKAGEAVYSTCVNGPNNSDNTPNSGGSSSGAGKNYKFGNNSDKKCPKGWTDAGVKDGWNKGKKYQIRLCRLESKYQKFESGGGGYGIPGRPVNVDIAENTLKMLLAAEADGIPLALGSTYRTNQEQLELRKKNCNGNSCSPATAAAGRSNHQFGVAVDWKNKKSGQTICWRQSTATAKKSCKGDDKKILDWMLANASKYSFYNLPSEAWHWSINGG